MSSLKANTIEAQTTNGDLTLQGNGTGGVVVTGLKSDTVTASTTNGDVTIEGNGTGGVVIVTGPTLTGVEDSDTLVSDSATLLATQQSIKAYVDTEVAGAGGGAWNLIATSVASGSASLDITGLDSTYDTYALVFSDVVPASDNANFYIRVGDSGGFDSGASDYSGHNNFVDESSALYQGGAQANRAEMHLVDAIGNAAGEGIGGVCYLSRPGDGTMQPIVSGTYASISNTGIIRGGNVLYKRNAVITLDRVQILFNNGNIATGRFSVYGVAHA